MSIVLQKRSEALESSQYHSAAKCRESSLKAVDQTQDQGVIENYSKGLRTRRPQVQVLPGAPNSSIAFGPLSSFSWRQVAPGLGIRPFKATGLGSSPRRPTTLEKK